MKLSKKLINDLEKSGFSVTENSGSVEFQKYSPAGQDFNFEIYADDLRQLCDGLYNYYDDFDVSYEAYIWLGSDGHGANGAPYDMRDLYDDMEICAGYITEAADIIRAYAQQKRHK